MESAWNVNNFPQCIGQAIQSVLAQSFSDYEIIVNDGSPDAPLIEATLQKYWDRAC